MSEAEIFPLPDGRLALVRYFPDPADSTPNPPIPVYIGPSLLGQRLTLTLRHENVVGVCVAMHRGNGVVVLAPARAQRDDGTWSTTDGKRMPYVREEIVCLTVDDLDTRKVRP